jgi:hypothetical protein
MTHFYSIFNNVLNRHAPIKVKRIKHDVQPVWITEEVKAARQNRDQHLKNKNFAEFKKWRNMTNTLIKKAKRDFFSNAVQENKDPAFLWKNIKDLSSSKGNTNRSIPEKIICGSNVILDKQCILDSLNNHFINISAPSEHYSDASDTNEYLEKIQNHYESILGNKTFTIRFITPLEVSQILDNLNAKKSAGLDGIGPRILKACSDVITIPLTAIINNSLRTGIVPDSLKLARVVPLHKGGPTDDANNYRPISVLPTISKIFERHVSNELNHFFTTTGIIHHTQSGFRKNHSCQTALVRLIDQWAQCVDDGNMVGALFLDLRKAFDTVNHDLLLKKLRLCHFSKPSLQWFHSYLSNRKQVVKCENLSSQIKTTVSGVPQGSILGPQLFLLYINDLPVHIEKCNVDMYADDNTIHNSGDSLLQIEQNIQDDLNRVEKWCQHNVMSINPTKSKCMLIGKRHQTKRCSSLNVSFKGERIACSSHQKILGAHVDNNLNWDVQTNVVYNKLNSKLALFRRIKPFLNLEMRKLFYNAYVLPIFDYGSVLWSTSSMKNLTKIINTQKRAARMILDKSFDSPSSPLFMELDWLPFLDRCTYHMGILTYKAINDVAPSYLKSILHLDGNMKPAYKLRSTVRKDIQQPLTKSRYTKLRFQYAASKVWNALPVEIRQCKSVSLFRKNVRNYLLR